MTDKKLLYFLNEMGFSEIQIEIYGYLLTHKIGTTNDIKNELNYSYTQVHRNLNLLEENNLIESSLESKTRLYICVNPKIALSELVNKKFHNFKENIKILDEELKIQESKSGRCLKDITFYHYSDTILAINNYHDLLKNTKKEIVITSLPLSLLRKLEPSFYDAYMRGIQIKIYFSMSDFNNYPKYFDELTNILRRVRVEIFETKQKTCQVIKYNDEIVNMGNILLDESYLNAVIFNENKVLHCDGFLGPFAKQAKGYLELLDVIKKLKIEYPAPIKNIIDVIEEYKSIKTRDLSSKLKIGGTKLRKFLEFLINEGVIKEEIIGNDDVGRPKRVFSLIN